MKRGACECGVLEGQRGRREPGPLYTPLINGRSGLTAPGSREGWSTTGCSRLAGSRGLV